MSALYDSGEYPVQGGPLASETARVADVTKPQCGVVNGRLVTEANQTPVNTTRGERKPARFLIDLTNAREAAGQGKPVVDLTGGRAVAISDCHNQRGRHHSASSDVSFATVPDHMLKNANNGAVSIPAAPTYLTRIPMQPKKIVNPESLNVSLPSFHDEVPDISMDADIRFGARGAFYDSSSVRFFYGKRWSDGMCDAVGKPLNILFCIVPFFWPFLLGSAAIRARPLIFRFCSSYIQVTSVWRLCLMIFIVCMLSFCFLIGLAVVVVDASNMPSNPMAVFNGPILMLVGSPGPVLWGLVFVAIRNRYQIRESAFSTFIKATVCPCLFVLRVKRHVDSAQGFNKPKGMLREALWATETQRVDEFNGV